MYVVYERRFLVAAPALVLVASYSGMEFQICRNLDSHPMRLTLHQRSVPSPSCASTKRALTQTFLTWRFHGSSRTLRWRRLRM